MSTKPTVPEVMPLVRAYQERDGNFTGGDFHIVLDDENVENSHVAACLADAKAKGDAQGVELGEMLLRMSKTQRKKIARLFYQ